MIAKYGFVADTNLTFNQNMNNQIIHLSIQELCTPSKTLSYHNLSFNIPLPKCTKNLLALGSKFCIKRDTTYKTKIQRKALRKLKNNTQLVIFDTDKNLGITIIKKDRYIKAIMTEHLNNSTVYENLSHKKAYDIINFTHQEIKNTLIEHQDDLKPNEQLYFERSLHRKYKIHSFMARQNYIRPSEMTSLKHAQC